MGFLEERDLENVPAIPEFYKGKTIFITGGSGFIGKVLIEKLLYSCPDLDRIYLLMRNKKGVKSEDRLQQIYSTGCFDRLRNERPGLFKSKVFIISGDCMELGLGLSEEDKTLLVNRVNIVFHVAASVRFDDPLSYAIRLNLRGTLQVVELCKEMRELAVLVHVSTSYSNTNRDVVEEVMYPPHADWRNTLEICDYYDEHSLRVITPKYLGEIPNTYTFSKQLAEHVVYETKGELPAIIIRPSIVISSAEEPVPGWIESFNGPVGIFVACGKGIMRSIYTKPDIVSDYIPVDVCVKHFIAAGWVRGTKPFEPSDDIPIYNCCAGNLNSIVMEDLVKMAREVGDKLPMMGALWRTGGHITTCETYHYFQVLFLHLLPAVMVDMVLWVLGKKTMLVKIQRRIFNANLALQYYITQQWTFDNKNFVLLRSILKEEDKKEFYYEVENISVVDYFTQGCKGAKKYLLNESEEDLPKARAHQKRLHVIDILLQFVFYSYVFWLLWRCLVWLVAPYIM